MNRIMNRPLLPGYDDAIVLSAYADGVLDAATAQKVEKNLADRPDLQPQLAVLCALQARLRRALPAAPATLDDAHLEVLISQAGRPPSPPIPWWKPTRAWVRPVVLIRLAAVLVVMVVLGGLLMPAHVGALESARLASRRNKERQCEMQMKIQAMDREADGIDRMQYATKDIDKAHDRGGKVFFFDGKNANGKESLEDLSNTTAAIPAITAAAAVPDPAAASAPTKPSRSTAWRRKSDQDHRGLESDGGKMKATSDRERTQKFVSGDYVSHAATDADTAQPIMMMEAKTAPIVVPESLTQASGIVPATPPAAMRPSPPASPGRRQASSAGQKTEVAQRKRVPRDAVEPPKPATVSGSIQSEIAKEIDHISPITALDLPINTPQQDADEKIPVRGWAEPVSDLEMGGSGGFVALGVGGGAGGLFEPTTTIMNGAQSHPIPAVKVRRLDSFGSSKPSIATPTFNGPDVLDIASTNLSLDQRMIPLDGGPDAFRNAAVLDQSAGGRDSRKEAPPVDATRPFTQLVVGDAAIQDALRNSVEETDVSILKSPVVTTWNNQPASATFHGKFTYLGQNVPTNSNGELQIAVDEKIEIIRRRANELNSIAQVSRPSAFALNVKLAEAEDDLNNEVAKNINDQDYALRGALISNGYTRLENTVAYDGTILSNKVLRADKRSALSPKDLSAVLAAQTQGKSGLNLSSEDDRLPIVVEPDQLRIWAASTTGIDTAGTEVSRGRALVAAARSVGLQVRLDHGRMVVGAPRAMDSTDAGGLDRAEFTAAFATAPFITTTDDARHTVAIAADTASFDRTRTVLASGGKVDPNAVQVEHFVNAVPFAWPQTPAPCGDAVTEPREAFTVAAEAGLAPFAAGSTAARTRLVAIGVRGNPAGADERQPLRLTLAIDASGSMAQPGGFDRLRRGLEELIGRLTAADRIAIVSFADEARVVLPATAGNDHDRIRAALDGIRPGGSTNCGDGLALAYQIAGESALPGVAARVVLATDGATLIGATEPTLRQVVAWRDRGVSLLVVGCGAQRYEAAALDRLADQGGGQHVYLGSDDDAVTAFRTRLLPARLGVLGRDAKLQVTWNPARISHARLIGFDQRRLKHSDFRKDDVHAGSLEQDAQVTALFEVVLAADDGAGPLGEARVRYHDTRLGSVRELACPLPGSLLAPTSTPSPRLRAAACAAELGEILAANWWANVRNAGPARLAEELQRLARDGTGNSELQAFVGQLVAMTRNLLAKPAQGKK